jgi:hypothetical protein
MPIDRDGDGPQLRKTETKSDDGGGLRATPFTEDVFDEEYYRGRGRASSNSPLGLIVGVAFGAMLAGGAAWFVLTGQGPNSGSTTSDGVAVVKADTAPYKIKPESPGGMQVENQDKTVYDRVAKTDAPNRVENLLPPPEQPKTPPKVEPKPEPKQAAKPAEPPAEVRSPLDEKRDELAAMIANLEKKPADGEKLTVVDPPTPNVEAASKPKPLAPPQPQPIPESLQQPTPAPTTTAATPVPAVAGGHLIQLAAAKSEEGALAEWNRIKTKHAALVGTLSPTVVRADLGERGIFFRLRAGTLPDKPAADALCAALTAQGDACLVVKP